MSIASRSPTLGIRTSRISSVVYAVDEIASEENTASASTFTNRSPACADVGMGRPTSRRFIPGTDSPFHAALWVG